MYSEDSTESYGPGVDKTLTPYKNPSESLIDKGLINPALLALEGTFPLKVVPTWERSKLAAGVTISSVVAVSSSLTTNSAKISNADDRTETGYIGTKSI
jgi:hypothetical protein